MNIVFDEYIMRYGPHFYSYIYIYIDFLLLKQHINYFYKTDLLVGSSYQGQGQSNASHSVGWMQSLSTAFDSYFWHTDPAV